MTRPDQPRRVCIAPTDVASYYSGLREGLVAQGIPCWFFDFDASPYTRYRPSPDAFFLERWVFAVAQNAWLRASAPARVLRAAVLGVLRVLACGFAIVACDVFVFAFSWTFLRGWELPLLRLLGRSVICVFNGSETRPAWMSGIHVLGPGAPDPNAILQETRRQCRKLRWLERWATEFVCHPLSAQLLHRPFYNHLQLGHPCAPMVAMPPRVSDDAGPLRILHAPTRPLQKGSDRFRAIVDQLQSEGYAIEYVEITGRPNEEVLAAIASCDLVLDEMYSDIPLAGLGSEAAWIGKPTVVGGYGTADIARYARNTGMPMDHFVHPDEVDRVARRLTVDKVWRKELGRTAQDFMRSQWSPVAVAGRFLRIVNRDAPADWLIEPATLTYWQGWGAPESAVRNAIRILVTRHGSASLGLEHNPALERHVCAFAEPSMEHADAAPTVG